MDNAAADWADEQMDRDADNAYCRDCGYSECRCCDDCDELAVEGDDYCASCAERIEMIGKCPICKDPRHGGKCEGFGDA